MKKHVLICLLIVIAMFFSACRVKESYKQPQPTEAETTASTPCMDDSLSIPPEELSMIGLKENEQVVKIYNCASIYRLAKGYSIYQVLEDCGEKYVVYHNCRVDEEFDQESRWYTIRDGSVNQIEREYNFSIPEGGFLFQHALSYDKILAVSTIFKDAKLPKIFKVYCLDGSGSHRGMYIYFETDQGDYVFYRVGTREIFNAYLFPLDVFCNATEKLDEECRKQGMACGTPILEDIFEPSELEPYLVGEINWD